MYRIITPCGRWGAMVHCGTFCYAKNHRIRKVGINLGNTFEGLWYINMNCKSLRGEKACILAQNIVDHRTLFQKK